MRRQPKCCFKDCDHTALPRRAFCGMHSIQRQDKATVIWHGAQLLLTDYGRLDVDIMGGFASQLHARGSEQGRWRQT